MNTALINNRYQIIKTIARGGFGETLLAIDTHMPSRRKCVLKQLKPIVQEPESPQWIQQRFQQEAATLETLGEESGQIPRLYAYFAENGTFYLAQEWIEGLTLTEAVQQHGLFDAVAVNKILQQILSVLEYIHSQKIIHRDLKPDNIILRSPNQLPVLIDFGAVKAAVATAIQASHHSRFTVAIGTPGYMSSEQAAGRPTYASDLYSLGLTAIFMLTGTNPHHLETDAATGEISWRHHCNLTDGLADIIDRAIRFNPRDRYQSASQMLQALQTLELTPSAATTQPIAPRSNHQSQSGGTDSNSYHNATTVPQSSPRQQNRIKVEYNPVRIGGGTHSSPAKQRKKNPLGWLLGIFTLLSLGVGVFAVTFMWLNRQTGDQIQITQPSQLPRQIPEAVPQPEEDPETIAESNPTLDTNPEPPRENNTNSASAVPIITLDTSVDQIRQQLGEPTSVRSGFWPNSTAILYRDAASGQVDLGYIVGKDSQRVKQTEATFDSDVDLAVMRSTLKDLLGNDQNPAVETALEQVYNRQTDLRSFNLGQVRTMIRRNAQDRIYIAVWQADFHP